MEQDDRVEVTCMTGNIPKGEVVPEHTHEIPDFTFPASGRGKIWIEAISDLELKKGILFLIP
jgi:quercetin dioxygenase-like cupin family protein